MDKTPPSPRRAGALGGHPNITLGNYAHSPPEGASVQAFGPHNQRYVQVPAAACAAPPRSPGARTLKGAAAPRSSDERLIVNPLMMHCRASHTVDMACIVQNLPRVLCPSGRKNRASGCSGPVPRRVGENPSASHDAIREKSPSRYDGTSDSPVAANKTEQLWTNCGVLGRCWLQHRFRVRPTVRYTCRNYHKRSNIRVRLSY